MMRLLDLFCGAGGAAMGYHRAGFEVVGVDIAPQPHYPFEFHQGDALTWPIDGFDVVHASPPCQFFTTQSSRWRGRGSVADSRIDLLTPLLERIELEHWSIPYVIENVEGANRVLLPTLRLHGGMFGLGVHRPRSFRSNVLLLAPRSPKARDFVGVYGRTHDGRALNSHFPKNRAASSLAEAHRAMGMDWADWHGTKEAIPPAYTEFIGGQLFDYLSSEATA